MTTVEEIRKENKLTDLFCELATIPSPTFSEDRVAKRIVEILNQNKDVIGFDNIKTNDEVAKVSIVGAGMVNNPGVASMMFEALSEAGINIHMISTSEIKVSVLVNAKNAQKAVQAICEKFNLAD